ncbi:hypothetical protein CURTO8I2_220053 [Curtobacterium sp. 8I-2]|nr:hypothetical protein CURTO8I2_220053 [Curtobacterium sp. 8I-2]
MAPGFGSTEDAILAAELCEAGALGTQAQRAGTRGRVQSDGPEVGRYKSRVIGACLIRLRVRSPGTLGPQATRGDAKPAVVSTRIPLPEPTVVPAAAARLSDTGF